MEYPTLAQVTPPTWHDLKSARKVLWAPSTTRGHAPRSGITRQSRGRTPSRGRSPDHARGRVRDEHGDPVRAHPGPV